MKELARKLPNFRFIVYGEYVRDSLLKLRQTKIDVFTSAPIKVITDTLNKNIIPHKHLLVSRNTVTTTTKDGVGIVIEHSPLKLMKKRANVNGIFTINTILYDVKGNYFINSTRSLTDLHNKVIKTANDPEDIFRFRPTTMIDACGLLALHRSIELGELTERELIKRTDTLNTPDRTQRLRTKMAVLKIMEYEIPSRAFRKMHELGVLNAILPELEETVGVIQNRHHNIHFCPDCKGFFILDGREFKKWDTSTVKGDRYTTRILNKYRKEK